MAVARRRIAPALFLGATLAVATLVVAGEKEKPPPSTRRSFDATAYALKGKTAKGTAARRGVVAADPKVLPLGSKVRVRGAGPHSGDYTVEDTGRAIKGKDLDIHVPDSKTARSFGRKDVQVEVLERGDGTRRP
ncbi:MAG TPA: 3D domain-containing protein [Candidatus Binatia bacterium]|jgi:3D (Asp-Asp-Asp) domain-containing protein|nr:3D domain-containing protein [Candidatus Binatia bacterium]